MKKRFLLMILMMVVLVTGCGEKKERIVIYTSMEEERNQVLREMAEEEFPDLDIVVQYMATGNSAAKIKNEGKKVEADIVLDLETAHMENVKDNFAKLDDFDSDIFIDGSVTDDRYFPWIKYTMNLIIDKEYFEEHDLDIPENYEDLLDKQYKGLIAMPDPKTSGTGYAFYLNVVNIMGEEDAIEYFKDLKKNLREFTTSGSGPTNLLIQGEVAIALGMTAQGVEAINDGHDFEIIELETGSPYNTTSCGIIDGREKSENVREVFEWIIEDYGMYDKENYMPDKVLNGQGNKMKNYPTDLKDADMEGINSTSMKDNLIEKWSEVNG